MYVYDTCPQPIHAGFWLFSQRNSQVLLASARHNHASDTTDEHRTRATNPQTTPHMPGARRDTEPLRSAWAWKGRRRHFRRLARQRRLTLDEQEAFWTAVLGPRLPRGHLGGKGFFHPCSLSPVLFQPSVKANTGERKHCGKKTPGKANAGETKHR